MKNILVMLLLLFSIQAWSAINDPVTEFDCLAKNIYFEAGNQSELGKLLVGITVMNRVYDQRFPSTICSVVKQRNHFSWYWDGKSDRAPRAPTWDEKEQWRISLEVAELLYFQPEEQLLKLLESFPADHYHSNKVAPYWSRHQNYEVLTQVGDHIFYRWNNSGDLIADNE